MRFRPVVLAAAFAAAAWPAAAQLGPVDISARQVQQGHHSGGSRSRGAASSASYGTALLIALQNTTRNSYPKLTVRYFLFAHDVRTQKVSLAKKGERTVSLGSVQREEITTEAVKLTHTDPSSGGRRGRGGRTRTVQASGQRFEGYGVQVLQDGAVLAEVFNPASLKQQAGAAAAAPAKKQTPQTRKGKPGKRR